MAETLEELRSERDAARRERDEALASTCRLVDAAVAEQDAALARIYALVAPITTRGVGAVPMVEHLVDLYAAARREAGALRGALERLVDAVTSWGCREGDDLSWPPDVTVALCDAARAPSSSRPGAGGGSFFDKRAADALAREVAKLIDRNVIDARSPAGDALLDYVNPGPTESIVGKLGIDARCAPTPETKPATRDGAKEE